LRPFRLLRPLGTGALVTGTVLLGAVGETRGQVAAKRDAAVSIGARVQAQFEANGDANTPASFFIRRAWVTMDGRYNDFASGRVQFDAQGQTVLEGYLQMDFSDAFQVQFGQFKKAVSHFWLVANSDLPIIERDARVPGAADCPGVGGVCSFGRLTGRLGLDNYEPGLLFQGQLGGSASYRVTLTNGQGISGSGGTAGYDQNDGKSVSGQLSVDVGGGTRVSGYLALDENEVVRDMEAMTTETLGSNAFGVEVEMGSWLGGPHLLANLLAGDNWMVSDDARFTAFQVLGLWYFPVEGSSSFQAVEPMLRVSWASTDSESMDMESTEMTGLAITPGIMFYASGRNGISVNLDVYNADGETRTSLKVQAFAIF